jgi:hypothetical protein
MSITTGDALSTFGIGAQGDLTGVGGAGGFATRVGFSGAPFRTKLLPVANVLSFVGAGTPGGAGDRDFGGTALFSFAMEAGAGAGEAGAGDVLCSSICGIAIFVPSVQVIASGAQSSSSSSISAQLFCPLASSDCSRLAIWMPYFLSSSSVNFLGSGADVYVSYRAKREISK